MIAMMVGGGLGEACHRDQFRILELAGHGIEWRDWQKLSTVTGRVTPMPEGGSECTI